MPRKLSRTSRNRKNIRIAATFIFTAAFFALAFWLFNKLSTQSEAVVLDTVVYETDTDFLTGTTSSTEVIDTGANSYIELTNSGGPDGTGYHREITVDNSGNATSLSEYQVVIDDLDTASLISTGKLQDDCDDLRFTDSSDVEVSYWIGPGTCNTANTIVYVKTPSIPGSGSTTLNMYYGNPEAAEGKDEAATFTYSTEKTVGYLLDTTLTGLANTQLMSLVDDNSITHNGTTYTDVDKGERVLNILNVNAFQPFTSKGLFQVTRGGSFSESVVPISWAGTEFHLVQPAGGAGSIGIFAIAPWGNATVDIYFNGVLTCSGISVTSSGTSYDCVTSGLGRYRVVSSAPILLLSKVSYSGGYRTALVTPPIQSGTYVGTGGTSNIINAGLSGVDHTIYFSNSASPTMQTVAANSQYILTTSVASPIGNPPAYKVTSSNPTTAAIPSGGGGSSNDGVYLGKIENMGTTFGHAATQTIAIAIASIYPATCTVRDSDTHAVVFTGTATSVNNEVYHLGFGTGDQSIYVGAEWYMDCDMPVYSYTRKFAVYDFMNWTYAHMRQYTYPEPAPTVGAEQVLYAPSGSWESSSEAGDVIDIVWNGGWGDGTPSSTAFEADLTGATVSENVTFQIRTAEDLEDLEAASYTTLGVATSSPFILTADDLGNLGVAVGFHRYIQIRATLTTGDEAVSPALETFTLSYLRDDLAPTTNATNVELSVGDPDSWVRVDPTIVWDAADDDALGSGVMGYCAALDEVGLSDPPPNNDPETSSGILNPADSEITHPSCPFIVSGEAFDLSTLGSLDLESGQRYYLSLKAIDFAGNVYSGIGFQNLLSFRFDSAVPKNVDYISVPNTVFGSVDDMFFSWPSAGAAASDDLYNGEELSGVHGWQYSINSTTDWGGTDYDAALGIYYIPDDGLTYEHTLSDAIDGEDIAIGNNIIYVRTVDSAGNLSSHVTGVLQFGGEAPQFAPDAEITITPSTNTVNSYSLSWPEANPTDGNTIESYYYMINRTPPSNFATLSTNSSIYIPTESTTVPTGQLTGSVRGSNSVCVVAVDNENNYSASNSLCGEYTLDSTVPDPVQNLFVTDSSVRTNELWRSTIVWEAPGYQGTGQLTYIVQRSPDDSSWTTVATTPGLAHTDIVPESQLYYYRVGVYDTSDESIASPTFSTSVSIIPRGSYTEPADLVSGPKVVELSTTNALITWTTGRGSDSKVQYGLASGEYFDEEPSKGEQVNDHEIRLINLRPGTQYFYRAKWSDEDGNLGISDEQSFVTQPAPVVTDPAITRVSLNFATLRFTVQNASAVKIYYGKSASFGGAEEISTATSRSTYSVNIEGLDDGSKYFYKINTFDPEGNEYEGVVLSFETLPRPQVSNIRIQQVKNSAQPSIVVTWDSNTEITSVVSYYPTSDPVNRLEEVDIELIKGEHQLLISNLQAETQYGLIVSGVDRLGNEALSSEQVFTTATDTRPPLISDVSVESSIVVTEDGTSTAQLVVSWNTDEDATSQVEYGIGNSTEYTQRTRVNTDLSLNHLVVISELDPSAVYHLRVLSQDSQGNQAQSGDIITITPKRTDSAFELVVNGLRDIFGFL
ncbi:MAG: DUF2341 domain-containing protein [Candidatus Dojkabacteria bacterium]|nr:MAG: DUF2341 domain-containing protein [Candidatus Dojkabacteria bacterium]